MTIEICVQTMRGYDDTLTIARWCEEAGVPALAVADHYLSGPDTASDGYDQLVILGGIARETTHLQLSTLVSPLTFRHPAVHLKAAVTLDEMSGGRFSLGVGTGWMTLEHESFGLELPPMGERFERLEESLAYIRAGTDGSGAGFEGTHYRLAPFDPQPRPTGLRLVVGGGGPRRTPDLAGRFADEFNVFPATSPMGERVERCRETASRAGRDAEAILVSTAFPAAVASDDRATEAILAARAARSKTDVGTLLSRFDELGIPRGTPDQAAASYAALAEAGVTRVYLQMAANDLDQVAEAVGAAREAAALAS